MTRETKIGLLVGLAFIIVIGILLSDHLTSSTEPQQAALVGAGSNVRQGVNSPGSGGASAPVTVVPPVITPTQTVATQHELSAPPVIVKIGGPATPVVTARNTESQQTPEPVQVQSTDPAPGKPVDPPVVASNDEPVTPVKTATPTDSELSKVAAAHGEPLVSVDAKAEAAKGKPVEYTALPNDSVSKICSKYLGSASKANIDLFVRCNPSLKGDPTKLMAGRAYQIPAAAAAKTAPLTPTPVATETHDADEAVASTPAKKTDAPVAPEAPAVKAAATDVVYTVRKGDNLTKIAREQVGDVGAVAAIQELNRDTLKGAKKDVVVAGMKLRLPGKAVARAE